MDVDAVFVRSGNQVCWEGGTAGDGGESPNARATGSDETRDGTPSPPPTLYLIKCSLMAMRAGHTSSHYHIIVSSTLRIQLGETCGFS